MNQSSASGVTETHGLSGTPTLLRPGRRYGLRGRITLAVTLVSLLMAILLTVTTVTVARNALVNRREQQTESQAFANAETIKSNLKNPEAADLQTLLSSLPNSGSPSLILTSLNGNSGAQARTVSVDSRLGIGVLPRSLIEIVTQKRQSSIMRFEYRGSPLLAVGVAIPGTSASYFQVHELSDIENAVTTMRWTLVGLTIAATLAAVILGYTASRYSLIPLRRIGEAAESVALGQLDTRIDYDQYKEDPTLAPLVANFNEMVSALQGRIERDARFASDVSHELRSPLTTLNASIDVLSNNRDALPERSQKALDLLTLDMKRFTQLVEDLLEISRFDAGAVRLESDTVALVSTVEAAIRMVSPTPVPVEADPSAEGLVIACDKRRLVRVLANFLDNAAKYADGATAVFVEASEPDMDNGYRSMVRIAVEDSGPGVPESERARIFDRFNRGDQGGSRGVDVGVGLGLALAAEHARLQGGRVWVEDRHDGGQGARFVLELPRTEPLDSEDEALDLVRDYDTGELALTDPTHIAGSSGEGTSG